MEHITITAHNEDIRLPHTDRQKNLTVVASAAQSLGWQFQGWHENALYYLTPNSYEAIQEIIEITVTQQVANITSKPAVAWYSADYSGTYHIQQLRQALAAAVRAEELKERSLHPMHREKWGAIIPSRTYLVTPVIAYINIAVFLFLLAMGSTLSPSAQFLFDWGGNYKEAIRHGEWWRMLTYMFLHGGPMHLFMNLFGLFYSGMFLEPLIGKTRLAGAYIITGIWAAYFSCMVHMSSVAVGASGAIFGMYGVLLALLTTDYIQKTARKTMRRALLLFVVYGLLAGLEGNTDNAAHLGGLISGLVVGYIFYPGMDKKDPPRKQWVSIIAMLVVTAVAIGGYFVYTAR